MNEILDNEESYLVLKYGKILLEENMILLDRLIQISEYILNKEIVIDKITFDLVDLHYIPFLDLIKKGHWKNYKVIAS